MRIQSSIVWGQYEAKSRSFLLWAPDNFKQFLGSAELAISESETTNQIAQYHVKILVMSRENRTGLHSTLAKKKQISIQLQFS